jgi:hypothetical protein
MCVLNSLDLKQRTRWAVGTLETAQELNWGLPGKHVSLYSHNFYFILTNPFRQST